MTTPPPRFDGPRFAVWLRKWMTHRDLTVTELGRRSGLHPSTIDLILAGVPAAHKAARGQKALTPAFNTIAALAHGLELQFSYVAAKAGVGDEGDRWSNFSAVERAALMIALGVQPERAEGEGFNVAEDLDCRLSETLDHRLREIASTVNPKEQAPNAANR